MAGGKLLAAYEAISRQPSDTLKCMWRWCFGTISTKRKRGDLRRRSRLVGGRTLGRANPREVV
jgi:hypothetical protein